MSVRVRVGRTRVRLNLTKEQLEDLVLIISKSSAEQVERYSKALREQVKPKGLAS
jgi:hypothetical protein